MIEQSLVKLLLPKAIETVYVVRVNIYVMMVALKKMKRKED